MSEKSIIYSYEIVMPLICYILLHIIFGSSLNELVASILLIFFLSSSSSTFLFSSIYLFWPPDADSKKEFEEKQD